MAWQPGQTCLVSEVRLDGDVANWISAISAVVSVLGAGFAWWRANLSRKARDEAVIAREEAEAARDRAERMTRATESMAEALEGPTLWLEPQNGTLFMLRARKGVQVDELLNRAAFVMIDFPSTPFTLNPGQGKQVLCIEVAERPLPPSLHLQVDGQSMHVPIPAR